MSGADSTTCVVPSAAAAVAVATHDERGGRSDADASIGCKLHAADLAHHDLLAICSVALAQIDTRLPSLHRAQRLPALSLRMSAPPMPVAAPAPPLFALLIPGRTLATNFTVIDQKKMMIQVPAPASIPEVTVCMLQPSIPADHAVAVYYALPPFSESVSCACFGSSGELSSAVASFSLFQPLIPDCIPPVLAFWSLLRAFSWQYLGSISLQYPTASFRAVWRDKIPADLPSIGIGLSVETAATIAQLQPADAREEERTLDSAKGIAKNLYEYMASYSQNTGYA